jgi:hypothetical protein
VILDVVVTDKKGAPVAGLTRDDFNVFENQVPQPIVSLEEARGTGPAAIAIHSTAELDRLEPQAPVSILVLDEATRVRIIVRANGTGKIGAGNYFLSEGTH